MTIGDTVRAALFSRDFPSVKPPEQMHFEQTIEEVINGEEVDLDELSPAEFLSSGEEDNDTANFLEIAEDLGILGDTTKKSDGNRPLKKQKTAMKEKEQADNTDKNKLLEEIGNMTEVDRKAIGSFYLSLKELRKGAKMTLNALTRMQELVEKYPSLDFLYKVVKPITEVMPQNPLNSLQPILMMSGVDYRGGGASTKLRQ